MLAFEVKKSLNSVLAGFGDFEVLGLSNCYTNTLSLEGSWVLTILFGNFVDEGCLTSILDISVLTVEDMPGELLFSDFIFDLLGGGE